MPKCKSCGKQIEFVKMSGSLKPMPVDKVPRPYWCPMPGETVILKVVGRDAITVNVPTDRPLAEVMTPHWATCTDPGAHRKTKKKGGRK